MEMFLWFFVGVVVGSLAMGGWILARPEKFRLRRL